MLVGWMLMLYGVFRIFVEFFREPDAQIGFLTGGLTMGQLLSVPLVLVGVWLVWRGRSSRARSEDGEPGGPQSGDGSETS